MVDSLEEAAEDAAQDAVADGSADASAEALLDITEYNIYVEIYIWSVKTDLEELPSPPLIDESINYL